MKHHPAFEFEMSQLDQLRGIHLDEIEDETYIGWSYVYENERLPRLKDRVRKLPLWFVGVVILLAFLIGRFVQP